MQAFYYATQKHQQPVVFNFYVKGTSVRCIASFMYGTPGQGSGEEIVIHLILTVVVEALHSIRYEQSRAR